MRNYFYIVTVTCETQEQADEVIVERISPDEDYGFEYSIDWEYSHEDSDCCPTCGIDFEWDAGERMYFCPNGWSHG